jgi:ribosome biogenesis GTPase
VYTVVLEDGQRVDASIRGRLKQQQRTGSRVVIGDRVEIRLDGEIATIESVSDRHTELVRRGRGRAAKILAANLDRVFVVIALREPRGSTQLIDRMLVLVEASGMHPLLVLNKADLEETETDADAWADLYRSVGYRVFVTSAESALGISELHGELCGGISALIGPSGAGKSSLLNVVDPGLKLRTGVLSRKTGTGRHTTVGSRLITLECGGLVADTPGFGDVGLWSIDPEAVGSCFPEFAALSEHCRFRGCTHLHEPGCAVREALEAGGIAVSRYESYGQLRREAEEQEEY